MNVTTQQLIAGVRIRLRRVSEQKLPDEDIRLVLTDLLRGYYEDLRLSHRDRQSRTDEVVLTPSPTGEDYIVNLPDAQTEFEAEKLEVRTTDGEFTSISEVRLVPYSTWSTHFGSGNLVGSFFGDNRLVINLGPETIQGARWLLTYRPTVLATIERSAPLPLPSDFAAMLGIEAALLCIPLVDDDSDEWVAWTERTLKIYAQQKLDWNNPTGAPGRWQHYLSSSIGPEIQPIRRSDRHNTRNRLGRPFVPFY